LEFLTPYEQLLDAHHWGWRKATAMTVSRRDILARFANGFGLLGLVGLLADQTRAAPAADQPARRPAAALPGDGETAHLPVHVGGPSHVDTFDPSRASRPTPASRCRSRCPSSSAPRPATSRLALQVPEARPGRHRGQRIIPARRRCIDDLCVIRSMVADNINHNGACLQMNTGEQAFSRPSLGSWLLYGLGSENQDLPGYVVISPAQPAQGAPLWSSSFLPAAFQGTLVADLKNPIANLTAASGSRDQQRKQLDALKRLNELHRQSRSEDTQLSARIAAFELAFRMQREPRSVRRGA